MNRPTSEQVALAVIVSGAAAATFHGLYGLALGGGFPAWTAAALPAQLDGAALVTARPWRDRTLPAATRSHARAIALGLLGMSVAGNAADVLHLGPTTPVRVMVAMVPPLVLGLVVHLTKRVHLDREHAAVETARQADALVAAQAEREARRQADMLRKGRPAGKAEGERAKAGSGANGKTSPSAPSPHDDRPDTELLPLVAAIVRRPDRNGRGTVADELGVKPHRAQRLIDTVKAGPHLTAVSS